ncbi:hypothetical protein EC988_009855, partial [Linderina pennispora]
RAVFKGLHMALNSITGLAGLCMLALGITGLTQSFKIFTDNTFPWLAVSLGVLVVTASAIGITGCIKESKYLIGSYTGVLALLVLLQIATVIIAWLQPEGTLVDRFRNEWQHLYVNDPKMLKTLEKANMCCGFSTPADFALPTDCSVNKKFGFTQGCLQPLLNNWNRTRG